MIRVFAEYGDRTDRKKARLKYLIDKWGVEKFITKTEKLVGKRKAIEFGCEDFLTSGCSG